VSKKILCLSGWGQKYDSLNIIFRNPIFDPFFIEHCNYTKFNKIDEFFDSIKKQKPNFDIVVGWSLGGQLALRLIEQEILKPKLLFLIAPPFQMVKDKKIQTAMSPKTFEEFYNSFCASPNIALKKFSILTAMNDKNSKEIAKNLDINNDNFANLKYWLEELKRFSCFDLHFKNCPKTIFLQGAGDMIVHPNQTSYFQKQIKDFQLETFKNCGHAPHLNDIHRVRKLFF